MSNRLNLIDFYYQFLYKEEVTEATLCILDKNTDLYKNKDLMKVFAKDENIQIYHMKMPRVFEKEYPFDQIKGSILEYLIENPYVDFLKRQDLNEELTEPFYRKSIKNIKCDYLHFIKIEDEEQLKMVLIVYSRKNTFNFRQKVLEILENKILLTDEEEINNELNKYIVNNSKNYYLYNDKNNKMYFSSSLQELMNVKKYYNRKIKKAEYDEIYSEINRVIRNSNPKEYDFNETKLYFFSDISSFNNKIYSLYDLEINKKENDLTIIYLLNKSFLNWNLKPLLDNLNKTLKSMMIQEYQYYQISNSELYIIIDKLIEQRILENLKNKIESLNNNDLELELMYLNTAYNLSINNLNFITLSKYLKHAINSGEQKFNINNYKHYIRLLSEAKYFSEEIIGQESIYKNVIDSVTLDKVGVYLGYYHLELEKIQKETFYHHASEYICKRALEIKGDRLYFRIHYGEFSNKKIWYNLRRIKSFKEYNIILSEIEIDTEIGLKKFISDLDRLHALGFKIFVDSSVYSSIMMNDIVSHFEGIYVEDYEMSIGDADNDSLLKAVLTFYLKENKLILLHQMDNYYQFKDPNILYINEIIKPQEN